MFDFHKQLSDVFATKLELDASNWWLSLGVDLVLLVALLLVTWLVYQICYQFTTGTVTSWFKKTENTWDDEFIKSRIIKRLTRLIPTLILWFWTPVVLRVSSMSHWAQVFCSILLIWISLSVIFSAINTVLRLYERRDISKEVPLQGISQTLKILLSIGGVVLALSVIIGKSPSLIFSGFGALTAILMLVFKDSILGLAAGLQLSSNRMIAVGDWIEVPKYGANGNVLELGLTTVKVQNWDKTITTIPTYALISDSFKNWRGMSESGVRRIKRSINININTVRFLKDDEVEAMTKLPLLHDYLSRKKAEFAEKNENFPQDQRQHTNIGMYRAYLDAYLRAHPLISNEATQLVRQLQPTEKGLPLELYLFLEDNNWVKFENVQSDLFDHFIAILDTFYLEVHQDPSGSDFKKMLSRP